MGLWHAPVLASSGLQARCYGGESVCLSADVCRICICELWVLKYAAVRVCMSAIWGVCLPNAPVLVGSGLYACCWKDSGF